MITKNQKIAICVVLLLVVVAICVYFKVGVTNKEENAKGAISLLKKKKKKKKKKGKIDDPLYDNKRKCWSMDRKIVRDRGGMVQRRMFTCPALKGDVIHYPHDMGFDPESPHLKLGEKCNAIVKTSKKDAWMGIKQFLENEQNKKTLRKLMKTILKQGLDTNNRKHKKEMQKALKYMRKNIKSLNQYLSDLHKSQTCFYKTCNMCDVLDYMHSGQEEFVKNVLGRI